MDLVVGIDIGGTKTKIGLVDQKAFMVYTGIMLHRKNEELQYSHFRFTDVRN